MRALNVLILTAFVMVYCGSSAAAMKMSHDEGMQEQTFTKHYDTSLFQVTKNGLYSIELVVKGGTLFVGPNVMDIIIHDRKDHDVKGAKIIIQPWMPTMGHGVSDVPEITERGGGRYTAEVVSPSMPGPWDLQIIVNAASGTDTAVFSFPDVTMREGMEMEKMGGAHDKEDMSHEGMNGMGAEGGYNYATTRTSENGMFTVTYEAEREPVPVGSIHAWRLDVADKDGNPVDGAKVEISGLMPAHGHGMNTKPEAMPEGGGLYLIEGMSFSMPGYWTVTVRVKKNGMEDSVTFDLDLK